MAPALCDLSSRIHMIFFVCFGFELRSLCLRGEHTANHAVPLLECYKEELCFHLFLLETASVNSVYRRLCLGKWMGGDSLSGLSQLNTTHSVS